MQTDVLCAEEIIAGLELRRNGRVEFSHLRFKGWVGADFIPVLVYLEPNIPTMCP